MSHKHGFRNGFVAALVLVFLFLNGGSVFKRTADAQSLEVDLALVLAVDVSWSVNYKEFRLQMRGLANAFRRQEIHDAIASGALGRIAVSSMQWADESTQMLNIPWTVIDSRESALAFAEVLEREPRRLPEGGTSIGAALMFAANAIDTAPVRPLRRVIDLSADGRHNRGPSETAARDLIVSRGMTINGLAILNEWPTLHKYFERRVVGGPSHFVIVSNDYEAFADAIFRKLLKEIVGPGIS